MREILFRGKKHDGTWAYGSLIQADTYCCILELEENIHPMYYPYLDDDLGTFDGQATPVNPKTIGQYIGMVDKDRNKIFEGDICRFREFNYGKMCWVGEISYDHCQFILSGGPNEECSTPFEVPLSHLPSKAIEIIGNIHDNPAMKDWFIGFD